MLAAGWVGEVEALIASGLEQARAMQSVGYRQIFEALATGKASDEQALAESIVRATRVFARRQRTWAARSTGRVVAGRTRRNCRDTPDLRGFRPGRCA